MPFYHAATGLTPGGTYHYRCHAVNEGGEGWSATATFTTPLREVNFAGGAFDGFDSHDITATPRHAGGTLMIVR